MKGKPVQYRYETNLKWTGEKKGTLGSQGKPDINVACPPEFGGHEHIWSPEDLFLSSVEVCTMTTFLWLAQKERIPIVSYTSTAEGVAELVGKTFQFSTIHLKLKIGISSEKDRKRVETIIDKIPRLCVVSASIKTEVTIHSDIVLN
jgi:organic hydroperoxide reductase OsmC/OhrA